LRAALAIWLVDERDLDCLAKAALSFSGVRLILHKQQVSLESVQFATEVTVADPPNRWIRRLDVLEILLSLARESLSIGAFHRVVSCLYFAFPPLVRSGDRAGDNSATE
jgi:hypothetical protein